MGTLGGNVCVDTRCNYYNQSYQWRKAVDFCMKKDGDICLVAPGSPRCWAVSSSDTAPVLWRLGATRDAGRGPAGERAIPIAGALPGRRHRLPHQAARRGPDRDHAAARRRPGARPTSSSGGAARSTSRCSASPRRCAWTATSCARRAIVLGAVASLPREAVEAGALLAGQRLTAGAHRPRPPASRPGRPSRSTIPTSPIPIARR